MGSNGLSIDQSLSNTIQTNYSKEPYSNPVSLMMMLSQANDIVSPWWSRRRDYDLRSFVKESDHLSGAVYNMSAKMTAIPIRIEARDKSIKGHVKMAEMFTDMISHASQFGEGWESLYGRFVEDLFTQDNGSFMEVIGPGDPDGPLSGMPISLAHLDATRCTRTGNALYPVIYEAMDGSIHKLHYTRVIFASQMPSTRVDMNGVGFCAVSRSINAAQNLIDISVYKQEKLGSRPQRQLIVTGGGLDPEDIQMAVRMAENSMNNAGLRRFSKTIVAGNRNIPDPKLTTIDLASMPDGFDERESVVLGMAVIAMAFGMDARELFPAMEAGATKADALVQHMKQRGKGPGQTLAITERQLDSKVLPPYLKSVFDFQDDAQDRQMSEIWSIRSQSRQRDIMTKISNPRVERQKMVQLGEISPEQFEELELFDGRLVDGVDVEYLFDSDDKDYKQMLGGTTDSNWESKKTDIIKIVMTSKDQELIRKARRALAAIYKRYEKPLEEQKKIDDQMKLRMNAPINGKPGPQSGKPDDSYESEKLGRKLGVDETVAKDPQDAK